MRIKYLARVRPTGHRNNALIFITTDLMHARQAGPGNKENRG